MKNIILIISLLLGIGAHGQILPGFIGVRQVAGAPANSYRTETNNYLNYDASLGSLSTTIKDGVDRIIRDFNGESNVSYTTYDVWGRLDGIYLILGGTSTSVSVNAKTPGTYNLIHTGSPTVSATNISYNNSSQYSDAQIVPTNSNTTSDLIFFGEWKTDAGEDLNASVGIASGGNNYLIIRSDNFRSAFCASNSIVSGAGTLSVQAWWSVGYTSSTAGNSYRNGVNIKSNTGLTIGNCGNRSFYFGACHVAAGPLYGGVGTTTIIFGLVGHGTFSDAEQTFIYNALNAFKTVAGK